MSAEKSYGEEPAKTLEYATPRRLGRYRLKHEIMIWLGVLAILLGVGSVLIAQKILEEMRNFFMTTDLIRATKAQSATFFAVGLVLAIFGVTCVVLGIRGGQRERLLTA